MEWKELAFLSVTLIFGFSALMAATCVRLSGKKEGREEFGVYFVKLFGLLFVATLAIGIVFVKIDAGARTGAYTILGTIAGYLAGSKVPRRLEK